MFVIFLILFVGDCECDEGPSDVIVTFGSGHSDSERLVNAPRFIDQSDTRIESSSTPNSEGQPTSPAPEQGSVLFIPRNNDDEEYLRKSEDRMQDLLHGRRTMEDVARKAFDATTNGDNVFMAGKNYDELDKKEKKKSNRRAENHEEANDYSTTAAPKRINCKNLNCDHQKLNPTCGAKLDHNSVKYRLFRSKCLLRKVNCGLNHDSNRYTIVEPNYCEHVGRHGQPPPPNYRPSTNYSYRKKQDLPPLETRRLMASKRSQNMDINGQFCFHICPIVCPDQYEPECAISETGQKRVFMNHCHLDMSSCKEDTAWRAQPLVQCVGEEAAENKQTRSFVAWMQNVGVVDARGRLYKE
ncbi:uncharacterized protein LOC105388971 [Plutella xylostella]|uniref:uncharacterized protein LOC105388971 n=1 Tax=Plutella xylostella TaxID=51655 RepID=UPI0020326961|nr:uncharacterized protein LOC105388971 [Plutella xylostella]